MIINAKESWRSSGLAILVALVSSLSISQPVVAAERFDLYGLEFPQPKSAPVISAEGRVIFPPDFIVAGLKIDLNKSGRVDNLAWNYPPADSQKFEPYAKSIRDIKFHPARFAGKNIAFTLSALIVASNKMLGTPVRLILPLDNVGAVTHSDLLIESSRANGFHPPALVSFPSYFYRTPPVIADTAILPLIAALRIKIDQSGSPKAREIVYASNPDLAEMILVAVNWAKFKAGDFRGEPISGTGILIVQFFSQLKYPTAEWVADAQPLPRSTLESMRIRWYPENVEFVQVPALRRAGKRTVGAALAYDRNSPKTAMIWVDTRGRIRVESTRGVNLRADRKLLQERIEALRFHPGFRLSHSPESGYFPEPMFAFGSIHLAPLDSLFYEIKTDFSLRKFQFPLRTPRK